jgi:hypothetical protein
VTVAPDYVGMGTEGDSPYLIGRGQAYSALDALRAAVREAAERCLSDPGLAASFIAASGGESLFTKDLSTGPLGVRLRENTPTADVEPPLLVAQGMADEVINIAISEAWVRKQCAVGHELDFRKYPDRTHMGVLDADSPLTEELTAWTEDRLAGRPAASTC